MTRFRPFSLFLTTLLLTLTCSTSALANSPVRQPGNLGVGLAGGYGVSGLSLKYFGASQSLQGTVGVNLRYDYIGLSADYLIELTPFAESDVVDLAPAVGLGAFAGLGDRSVNLGVSAVGGLEFLLVPVPIDLVIEWRPSLLIVPSPRLALVGFTGHVRYYF